MQGLTVIAGTYMHIMHVVTRRMFVKWTIHEATLLFTMRQQLYVSAHAMHEISHATLLSLVFY